jgi:hypothetical protein
VGGGASDILESEKLFRAYVIERGLNKDRQE